MSTQNHDNAVTGDGGAKTEFVYDAGIRDLKKLMDIGKALKDEGCRGFAQARSDEPDVTIFYSAKPNNADFVVFRPGTVVAFSPSILKQLCELHDIGNRSHNLWICEKKGFGRLYAKCSKTGCAEKSQGMGKRRRLSSKVGCPATVKKVPLTSSKNTYLLSEIECHLKSSNSTLNLERQIVLCVVQSVKTEHGGHIFNSSEVKPLQFRGVLKQYCDTLDIR